ncbi:phasin family protein [Selenihalanaerobacter shriftii]|uniref:Polyhydroxyalkanoate synthesis regulator phasin n=1 Tax=Selenihalanaerobacter shriftii TaxID=142842 RepID=A0A1T4MZC4_9FIRM|nr:hypothetical protein [Selenihalanaerobacter shriftii]SJZ72342.1 Polyhydroxyalkanoate synthesis regulator phasin [Selenihalanaerobacter shriftii]
MFELFKKTLATGLGVMLFTKEKAEKMVDELVEEGRISQQEAEEIIDELMDMAEEEKNGFKGRIEEEMNKLLNKTGLNKDKEISNLKDDVRKLGLEIEFLKGELATLKAESEEAISEVDD